MPFFETSEGISIHYETAGEGLPLLFIHGWASSGSVWELQKELAESWRLIMPDLRGHGLSSHPDSGYSFEDFARDLHELFINLDLTRVVLVAWSMGVLTALQAFPLIRERLAALVFVSGTSKFTADNEYPDGLPSSESRGLGLRLKKDFEGTIRDFTKGMFTESELGQGSHDRMLSAIHCVMLPGNNAAQDALKSLASADLRSVLPTVGLPVLLITGSADRICPSSASRYMAGLLPDARLEILEGAGHAPFITRPVEFAASLKKFIEGILAND